MAQAHIEFIRLKTDLIQLQDFYESEFTIRQNDAQNKDEERRELVQLLKRLLDLDESLKDFQADFYECKCELGFLRFHFHKLSFQIYKRLENEKKWMREQRIYLQYSMYADESELKLHQESAEQKKTDAAASSESETKEANTEFEMLEESELLPQQYKTILYEDSGLSDKNLHVIKQCKFFGHFFESCDEHNIETNADSKKVEYYTNMNNLKFRLEHFIKEDLISLEEKKEKSEECTKSEPNFDANNEKYMLHMHHINSDIQSLNILQLEVDQNFCFFQKKFILKSLNLTGDEFKLIFYENTESARTAKEKYNKYVLLFHPDKNSFTNRSLLTELFMKLTNIKSNIVCKQLKHKNKYDMSSYKQEGLNFFEVGMDYYYCSLQQFTKLKFIDLTNIDQNDQKSNEKLAKLYFEQAYEKFRDACLIADEEKNYAEMLDLRVHISKCFSRISTRKLEAQLAAVGCIYLVNRRFPDKYTDEDRNMAHQNAEDIKNSVASDSNEAKEKRVATTLVGEPTSTKAQLNSSIQLFREFLNVDKNLITIYTDKKFQEHELLKSNIKTGASLLTTVVAAASTVGNYERVFRVLANLKRKNIFSFPENIIYFHILFYLFSPKHFQFIVKARKKSIFRLEIQFRNIKLKANRKARDRHEFIKGFSF